MYLRAAHAEPDIPTLRDFIKENQLGILITSLPSSNYSTIQCSHIPWVLDVVDDGSTTELGILRGHMARANPHAKALIEAITSQDGDSNKLQAEVTVLFNGPVHSYVTPRFYTETKPATGKVVPTWNYAAVQAYGTATVYVDGKSPSSGEFLEKQINDLTNNSEAKMQRIIGGKAWEVSDSPTAYVEILKKAIMGIEIEVHRLEGKWKMSQEMPVGDREGVVKGFEGMGTDVGKKIAAVVEERGRMKDAKKASG